MDIANGLDYGGKMLTTSEPTISPENATVGQCSIFGGQLMYCNIFYGVVWFTAVVSMLSCLFVIFIIWAFRMYKVFAQRQILYLALSVLLISCSTMATLSPASPFCTFKGWAHTYFYWCEIAWICCITFNLYMNAIRNTLTDRFEWVYHLVSWGFTFIICLIPLCAGRYGPAGLWCSISGTWEWRFGIWYLPRYVLIAALFVTYVYTMVVVNRRAKAWSGLYDPDTDREKVLLKEYVKPLRAYPFVYLAVSVLPLVNRLQNATSSEPVFALYLLQGFTANLHGFLNAIVYCSGMRSILTCAQIKIAFMSHFFPEATVISEYPTTSTTTIDLQPPTSTSHI